MRGVSCLLLNVPLQFRKVLQAKDENGMTFLHHAVNTRRDATDDAATGSLPPPSTHDGAEMTHSNPPSPSAEEEQSATTRGARDPYDRRALVTDMEDSTLDPWVPVVTTVLEFARQSLWLPEARKN